MMKKLSFAVVVAVMLVAQLPAISEAREFRFLRATDTTACIHYRNSASDDWGYLYPNLVTRESAEYFCRTYYPGSESGVILSSSSSCWVKDVYRYNSVNVACPYNSTTDANCTIDSGSASYTSVSFYAAAIKCLVSPSWANLGAANTFPLSMGGTYGTLHNRTVTVDANFTMDSVRPDSDFAYGTICLPPDSFNATVSAALCRSADLLTNNASTSNGTFSSSQRYIANIQCSDSPTATLFNGGCTNTTHYYDTPTTECSTLRPRLSCPSSFDYRLGEATLETNYFQDVEVRRHNHSASNDDSEFDGTMCVYYNDKYRFARAMCLEMYGSDNAHFSAVKQNYITSSSDRGKRAYINVNACTVATSSTLAQCTGIARPSYLTQNCSYQTLVSCRMTEANTVFSLEKDENVTAAPGHGYLMATTTSVSNTRAVCSNGFNQAAVLAACRSIGYTPGPSASFTVASAPTYHNINNVTCATGANKLTDCQLQYSGTSNLLTTADATVCGGRVLIDCDLGTPMAEFRTTVTDYLQVRLYPNSNWGWVREGITTQQSWNTMCNKNTSTGGDDNIQAGYLYVKSCKDAVNPTSYLQCTYEYIDGTPVTSGRHRCYEPASSAYASPSSSSISSANLEIAIGFGVGVPVGVVVIIVIIYLANKQAKEKAARKQEQIDRIAANTPQQQQPTKTPAELMEENMMAAAAANNNGAYGQQHTTKRQRKAQRKAEEEAAQFGGGGPGQFVYGNDPSAAPGTMAPAPYNAWQGAPQEMATGIPMGSFQPQPSPYPPQGGPPIYNQQQQPPAPYGVGVPSYVQPPQPLYNNEASAFQSSSPSYNQQQLYGAETDSPYIPQSGI